MIRINKVIKVLILSDFLLQAGWGLIGPIFAIFLTKQIQGGSLLMVGLVAATYWIVKSIFQPFLAYSLDKKQGEKDDFKFLIGGMFFSNLVPLGYLFSSHIYHIFILEAIRGIAMAYVIPSWSAIFTRHIDRGREAFSWSIESTSLGLAFGFAAAFGGATASFLGFKVVFVLVTTFGLLSTFALTFIRNQIFPKDGFAPHLPPSEKPF